MNNSVFLALSVRRYFYYILFSFLQSYEIHKFMSFEALDVNYKQMIVKGEAHPVINVRRNKTDAGLTFLAACWCYRDTSYTLATIWCSCWVVWKNEVNAIRSECESMYHLWVNWIFTHTSLSSCEWHLLNR